LELKTMPESWQSTNGGNQPQTSDSGNQEPPINWERLHQLANNDSEFETELLQIFLEDARTHLNGAGEAFQQQEFVKLKDEAHQLKGASANVGAVPIQNTAAELEKKARAQDPEGMKELFQKLENLLAQMQQLIEDSA
jgi:hypothetical protein